MRVVTLRTGLAAIVAGVLAWTAPGARAQVTITQEPGRPSLLYSSDSDLNCSDLSVLIGDSLPYNVVRLRAQMPAGADRIEWSLPKPEVGFLLADEDLGPEETTAAVRGFCAEFGNACLLTKQTLKFYNQETILYAAPTCDALPKDTSKAFLGGSVSIKATARAGKKKMGKAVTQVRWGDPAVASTTLYTNYQINAQGDRVAFDGIGEQSVQGFAITEFNATVAPDGLPGLPPVTSFDFEFASSRGSESTCPAEPEEECVALEAQTPGTFLSTVAVRLDDGSALCDALNVNVGACPRKAQVQIIRVPSKRTYTSGDPARLRVRFANLSENRPGCSLVLQGENVLTCSATFNIDGSEETKTDQWDLQHCSVTTTQGCTSTDDCGCRSVGDCPCPTCEPNEVCLLESHCSKTFTQLCDGDSDCELPACPGCQDDETCIRVLATPEILVAPGQAVDLVDEEVILKNEIGSTVAIKETWTANAFPQTSADASIKYKIKGD